MAGPIRVLVAKPGLDGHDRGAKVVARALRDAGIEVIYTGLHQTPAQVVDAAVQEDVDFIGLSILSGAHLTLFAEVMDLLRSRKADDNDRAAKAFSELGVAKIFTPGATTMSIVEWVEDHSRAVTAGN